MSDNNTLIRSLHDTGLAAWFGGSLMGAVGLNGATANANDPKERLELSHQGWTRWAPVNAAAIGSYLIGSVGMLAVDSGRIARQPGAGTATLAKTALTAVALGLTGYSWKLNRDIAPAREQGTQGATEPGPGTQEHVASAQRQLKALQWLIPVTTGGLVVLQSLHGEQQRQESALAATTRSLKKVLPGG